MKNPHLHWYFITITLGSKKHKNPEPDGNRAYIQLRWSWLRKRLARKYQTSKFVRVYEKHTSGVYHMHTIVGLSEELETYPVKRYNKKKKKYYWTLGSLWVERVLKKLELGYIYDIQLLTDEQMSYVAKYASMQDADNNRNISFSEDFDKLPSDNRDKELKWSYVGNVNIVLYTWWLAQLGATIVLLTEDEENED